MYANKSEWGGRPNIEEVLMLKLRCVFKARRVLLTTVERVKIKRLFTAFCYNLYQVYTFQKQGAPERASVSYR
jgi:hypothetical protein